MCELPQSPHWANKSNRFMFRSQTNTKKKNTACNRINHVNNIICNVHMLSCYHFSGTPFELSKNLPWVGGLLRDQTEIYSASVLLVLHIKHWTFFKTWLIVAHMHSFIAVVLSILGKKKKKKWRDSLIKASSSGLLLTKPTPDVGVETSGFS